MITFEKIIVKKDIRFALFVKETAGADFQDENLVACRFINKGVDLKKLEAKLRKTKDFSKTIDIVQDGEYAKVVRL